MSDPSRHNQQRGERVKRLVDDIIHTVKHCQKLTAGITSTTKEICDKLSRTSQKSINVLYQESVNALPDGDRSKHLTLKEELPRAEQVLHILYLLIGHLEILSKKVLCNNNAQRF